MSTKPITLLQPAQNMSPAQMNNDHLTTAISFWMKIKLCIFFKKKRRDPKKVPQILQGYIFLPRVSLGLLCFSCKFPSSFSTAIPFIMETCVEMKIDSRSKISNIVAQVGTKKINVFDQNTCYIHTTIFFTKNVQVFILSLNIHTWKKPFFNFA